VVWPFLLKKGVEMKGYKLKGSGIVFCFVIGFCLFMNAIPALAAEFCVDNSIDLQAALDSAASSDEDDVIRIIQGSYLGNFVYASTNSSGVSIEGGYSSGCLIDSRVVDSTNTVLDGEGNGAVLVFSAPNVFADFSVDGLTIQNGNVSNRGGGLYAIFDGRDILYQKWSFKSGPPG
jgi:hypothetical protein